MRFDNITQKAPASYLIHGLLVKSTIDLAPLQRITEQGTLSKSPDIEVRQQHIESFTDDEGKAVCWKRDAHNSCWVDITGIARFHISDGNLIEVSPYPDANMQSVLLYFFGSIMAVCFYQRGALVLHANAIEIGESAVLIAGDSGSGKSTTAVVFHQKGFNVLSDDVVVLNEKLRVMGGFPQIKLFQDTLDQLNISSKNLTPIAAQTGKFSFPLLQQKAKELPISAIYYLNPIDQIDEKITLTPIKGAKRFQQLINNTYRHELIYGLEIKAHHLDLCSKLESHTRMMNVFRPTSVFCANELADAILTDFEQPSH